MCTCECEYIHRIKKFSNLFLCDPEFFATENRIFLRKRLARIETDFCKKKKKSSRFNATQYSRLSHVIHKSIIKLKLSGCDISYVANRRQREQDADNEETTSENGFRRKALSRMLGVLM